MSIILNLQIEDLESRKMQIMGGFAQYVNPTADFDQKVIIQSMGGICPIAGSKTTANNNNNNQKNHDDPAQSARPANIPTSKTDEAEKDLTQTEKKTLNDSLQSSTLGKGDKFAKIASTTFGSSVLQRKNSSLLFQGCIFQSSSIILKNGRQSIPSLAKQNQNCYVLIDNVFLVKKSMDSIKVMSPHSQSQLNCPINNISSTYYLSQGAPLDSIKEISTGKIIQTTQSPINTKVKLVCKNCQKGKEKPRQIKMTFSSSLINLNQVICDQCNQKGDWKITNISSNFPLWGKGQKIQKNSILQGVPNIIRVMGCVSCLRYTQTQKLSCSCLMCKNCLNQNKQCPLCLSLF